MEKPRRVKDMRGHKWKIYNSTHAPKEDELNKLDHIRNNFITVEDDEIDYAKQFAMKYMPQIKSTQELRLMAGKDFLYAFNHKGDKHIFCKTQGNQAKTALTCEGEFEMTFGDKLGFNELLLFNNL